MRIIGDSGHDTVFVDTRAGNVTQVIVNETTTTTWAESSFPNGIWISTGDGDDYVWIQGTRKGLRADLGAGRDQMSIGNNLNEGLDRIQAPIVAVAGTGVDGLLISNWANSANDTVTLRMRTPDIGEVLRTGTPLIEYRGAFSSVYVASGSGASSFTVEQTHAFTKTILAAGKGDNTVRVLRASGPLTVHGSHGDDAFNVGRNNLVGILGTLNFYGGTGSNTLNVTDRTGTASQQYSITSDRVTVGGGLLTINHFGVQNTTVTAGSGDDNFFVNGTAAGTTTTLNTGRGADRVNVWATNGPLNLEGGGGADTVNLGNDTDGVRSILGAVTVLNPPAYTTLNINNTGDTIGRDVTLRSIGLYSSITGLAPGTIQARQRDLSALNIFGGSGGNTFDVQALPTETTIYPGTGDDLINVGTAANTFENIGSLNIVDRGGTDQLLIRDQGTTTPRSYELAVGQFVGQESRGSVSARPLNSRGNWQTVNFDRVESVTLNAGSGGNFFKIHGTPAATSMLLHTGTGNDTVDVGSSNPAFGAVNSLRDIRGPLSIDSQGGTDDVILRDNGDPNARNYTLAPTVLVRSDIPAAPIFYANVETLALKGSAGDNVFALTSTAIAPAVSLDGGDGVNTLDYSTIANVPNVPNAVSWYQGEGSAADSAGGNHGTIHGDVTFVPGQVGQAFDFDGDLDYVDLGSDASLDLPGSMSVSLWVRLDTLDHFKYFLADFDTLTGSTTQGSLGTVGDTSTFAWVQSHSVGTYVTLAGTTPIVLNQWFHLAAVRDDDAKTVRLYVNGVEDASLNYAGQTVVPLQGSKILGGSGPDFLSDFLDGQLDEVGIYNRALSFVEIQALAGKPSGVVVNLPLSTASGLTGGIALIQNVIGSSGNDILVGNGGNVLSGGAGRDLLIAGALASILNGGDDEDILIGGTTNYDNDAVELMAIMAEWTRTDGIDDDYPSRVANLKVGTNGAPILMKDTTVHSNGGGNTLNGNLGRDFFFANLDLDTLDRNRLTEELVEL